MPSMNGVWTALQVSARCTACGGVTPVNAAVDRLTCIHCGADFSILPELWGNILAEAQQVGRSLEPNAIERRSFDGRGLALSMSVSAAAPACPHCQAQWSSPPVQGCHACQTAICVRAHDRVTLVAEDAQLLAGHQRTVEPISISCGGCGAPVPVTGQQRALACVSCLRESVVPDDVWRRVNAPHQVATWFVVGDGQRSTRLRRFEPLDLAAGSDAVYILGRHGDTPNVLVALDADSPRIRWSVDMTAYGMPNRTAAGCGKILAYAMGGGTVEVFDAATGAHVRRLSLPEMCSDIVPDPDGSYLARGPTRGLYRLDASGKEGPPWPRRGWFARLFSSVDDHEAPPRSNMTVCADGRLGMGQDGELRITARNWVARFARDGKMRWRVQIPEANTAIVPPGASSDGKTYAVFRTVGGDMTVQQVSAMMAQMVSGQEANASTLFEISADGRRTSTVRPSGSDEYIALAVLPNADLWIADLESELSRLNQQGELVWRQKPRHG